MMIVHNVEQKSKVWLELRRKYISATDIAKLAGLAGFTEKMFCKSMQQFIEEKTGGAKLIENAFMDWGNVREQIILDEFNKRFGYNCQPLVASNGDLIASYDGIDTYNKIIVEIKTTNLEGKSQQELGAVLGYYSVQVLAQLLVATNDYDYRCYLAIEHRGGTYGNFKAGATFYYIVDFDISLNKIIIRELEAPFTEPIILGMPDIDVLIESYKTALETNNTEKKDFVLQELIENLVKNYGIKSQKIALLEAERDDIKAELIELQPQGLKCAYGALTKVDSKPKVDVAAWFETLDDKTKADYFEEVVQYDIERAAKELTVSDEFITPAKDAYKITIKKVK